MHLHPATARLALACFLFFLSGSTALIYQVVWHRLLGLYTGTDVYAATIIVGAFMAGLGCGSLAGGRAANRLSRRSCLLAFAVAELATGLFGWFSVPLFYDLLHLRFGHVAPETLMPIVLFASLLWPTFFIGHHAAAAGARADAHDRSCGANARRALRRECARRERRRAAHDMVAAAALRTRGRPGGKRLHQPGCGDVRRDLAIGTASHSPERDSDSPSSNRERPAPGEGLALPAWIVLSGLSGFLALSLEIVWFRTIGVIVSPRRSRSGPCSACISSASDSARQPAACWRAAFESPQ